MGTGSSSADAVETALAEALRGATTAGRWDLVSQLATELEARRRARESLAICLDQARTERNGGGR